MVGKPQPNREGGRDKVVLDNKFCVLAPLGERAGALRYAGVHQGTGREVEVHLLPSGLSAQSTECVRMLRAARASGRAPHSNVLNVVDSGLDPEGRAYVVYERFASETLEECIGRDGPMTPDLVVEVMSQVLLGLQGLHARGVLHRYLRPENVLIERALGQVRIKLAYLGYAQVPSKSSAGDEPNLPRGYSRFAAPELRRGEVASSVAVDVYAAGVLLRFLAAGDAEPGRVLAPNLSALAARATAEDAEDRFVSAAHFAAAIALLRSDASEDERRVARDSLLADLRFLQQRKGRSESVAPGTPVTAAGLGRIELYPALLMIEAIYARLGSASWQALVQELPEVQKLLPSAGESDAYLEHGVPAALLNKMLSAAERLGGRGDLSFLVEVGASLQKRGLARFCRDLPALSSVGAFVDCAHLIWPSLSRHGEAVVSERKSQGARLTVRHQVEPSLALSAVLAGLLRAQLRVFSSEAEVHISGSQALGDAADVFVLSFS